MKSKYWFFVLFLISCFIACSTGIDSESDVGEVSNWVINGDPVAHSEYGSVGALMYDDYDNPYCTVTLFDSDYPGQFAMTAAHCIRLSAPKSLAKVAYGFHKPVDIPRECFLQVVDWNVHQDYYGPEYSAKEGPPQWWIDHWLDMAPADAGVSYSANDIAIIQLAPVDNLDYDVDPILTPGQYEGHLDIGSIVTIAGYGQHIRGMTGDSLYAGPVPVTDRWLYEMIVGEIDSDAVSACYGDSGGPAYAYVDGVRHVTGITSRASGNGPTCASGAIYSVPGDYYNWFMYNVGAMIDYPKEPSAERVRTSLPEYCLELMENEEVPEGTPSGTPSGVAGSGGFGGEDPAPDVIDPVGCNCDIVPLVPGPDDIRPAWMTIGFIGFFLLMLLAIGRVASRKRV